MAFQGHMGLAMTGSVDAATWRALLWHYELPHFSASALCNYSIPNGAANWGTAEMISTLEASGAAMVAAGDGQVSLGDVSLEHGGDIVGHATHEVGLDADIRPMRKANNQCSSDTRWSQDAYDRAATRALIAAIHAATPGHVKLIYFNDPVLIREGLTIFHSGHDDHLHLRLCEANHPRSAYRC
jgi:murein endopeptidase